MGTVVGNDERVQGRVILRDQVGNVFHVVRYEKDRGIVYVSRMPSTTGGVPFAIMSLKLLGYAPTNETTGRTP